MRVGGAVFDYGDIRYWLITWSVMHSVFKPVNPIRHIFIHREKIPIKQQVLMDSSPNTNIQTGPLKGGWPVQIRSFLNNSQIILDQRSAWQPGLYNVTLLNDDQTPMDFVVHILKIIFNHPIEQALRLMLETHHLGQADVGVYAREVAEQMAQETMVLARDNWYPLRARINGQPGPVLLGAHLPWGH